MINFGKRKQIPYEIRWARVSDWQETMNMIWRTFMKFEACDYTQEGIANFHSFISDGQIFKMFLEGSYLMMVALDGEKIIGQISVRSRNHISLLFVDEVYHKKGVGRALINAMADFLRNERKQVFMSVKAAPYAVGFYRRTGFHICEPEQEFSGIRVTPMEKFLYRNGE